MCAALTFPVACARHNQTSPSPECNKIYTSESVEVQGSKHRNGQENNCRIATANSMSLYGPNKIAGRDQWLLLQCQGTGVLATQLAIFELAWTNTNAVLWPCAASHKTASSLTGVVTPLEAG